MKSVIIIGTIHGETPKDELIAEIEKYKPDLLLIELTSATANGPDEMLFARNWAQLNDISAVYFDVNFSTRNTKEGFTEALQVYETTFHDLLGEYSWQELNNEALWELPAVVENERMLEDGFYEKSKLELRDREIEANIKNNLVEGINVVITGAGHLTHLLEAIPGAIAPLRDSLQ